MKYGSRRIVRIQLNMRNYVKYLSVYYPVLLYIESGRRYIELTISYGFGSSFSSWNDSGIW